jgi:hypothetical protein
MVAAGACWACHSVRIVGGNCGGLNLPSSQIEADGKLARNFQELRLFGSKTVFFGKILFWAAWG